MEYPKAVWPVWSIYFEDFFEIFLRPKTDIYIYIYIHIYLVEYTSYFMGFYSLPRNKPIVALTMFHVVDDLTWLVYIKFFKMVKISKLSSQLFFI